MNLHSIAKTFTHRIRQLQTALVLVLPPILGGCRALFPQGGIGAQI